MIVVCHFYGFCFGALFSIRRDTIAVLCFGVLFLALCLVLSIGCRRQFQLQILCIKSIDGCETYSVCWRERKMFLLLHWK